MHLAQLHVGGLVAIAFDESGRYLLTVSHSGRGVFDTSTWQRVTRDTELTYPVEDMVAGIGPLAGQLLRVAEVDSSNGKLSAVSANGVFVVSYEDGMITVHKNTSNGES